MVIKMGTEKWLEQFSGGDIWELREDREKGILYGEFKSDSIAGYEEDEIVDNGISSVHSRAELMGLNFQEVKMITFFNPIKW